MNKCFIKSILLFAFVFTTSVPAFGESPGLGPWNNNPWYWSFNGEPILLLGGSDDDNLFQWSETDLVQQLDRLKKAGGNVIRNTMSDRKDLGFEVYAFQKLDSGKFDLNEWNDEYWKRFERMLDETAKRQIFVQIEVWDRFDYVDQGGNKRWAIHPYNPANNVNYTYEESGFAPEYLDHPAANKQPFFFTTPEQKNNQVVLQFQQRFVSRMLEASLKHSHVLYCIDNETSGDVKWSRYWAEFIRTRAAEKGTAVMLTEMWDDWDLKSEQHKQTFDHPDLFGFVDVSQNNHNQGDKHWDNFLSVRRYLSSQPRPMNTTKTYGADGNKFGHTYQDGVERFWRHLLAGAASMRFHRPDSGLGLNDRAVACIRSARELEKRIPLWTVSPAMELLSDREPNEAYLAADAGVAYALYLPAGGSVAVDLSAANSQLTGQWIDIDSGKTADLISLEPRKDTVVASPSQGNWALAITVGPAE